MTFIIGLVMFVFIGTYFTNCSNVGFGMSPLESAALKVSPFSSDDGNGDEIDEQYQVAGVDAGEGLPTENLRVTTSQEANANLVTDCTAPIVVNGVTYDRKEWERSEAIRVVSEDSTQKTVPVEYAISFGQKEDRLAVWAHNRAVLSDSNPGYTIVPVGGKISHVAPQSVGATHAYYKADHASAKKQYIYGERCFYSTIKLTTNLIKNSTSHYDFILAAEPGTANAALVHTIHYMYYGWCANCAIGGTALYGAGSYSVTGAPNRLFDIWPHAETNNQTGQSEPQFIKLYVADLRDGQFRLGGTGSIITESEDTVRGHEAEIDVKEHVNLPKIFENLGQAIRSLSAKYQSPTTTEVFSGMVGVPQLLTNLNNLSIEGTLLASQYTPLVLDLGSLKVRTTSVSWGTFFNMSLQNAYPHRTAWLGGDLVDFAGEASGDGLGFKNDFRRISEDGFLVLPGVDGSIKNSQNLFGDNTPINGQTYSNGFEALRAYAKKDCASSTISDRYLGPWDGDIYSKKLKVWVDRNRNGKAEVTELRSLASVGVLAINSCFVAHSDDKDAFGTGTSLRSTFLMAKTPGDLISETDILQILDGSMRDPDRVEFRLLIDLIFQVKPDAQLVKVN